MEQNTGAEIQSQPQDTIPSAVEPISTPRPEEMVPKSKVEEIVRSAYARGAQKAREDGNKSNRDDFTPTSQATGASDAGFGLDQMRKIAAEEAYKLQTSLDQQRHDNLNREQGERIAKEFFSKLESGRSRYKDFDEVVGKLDLRLIPEVVHLANGVENTADVMYELAKNPLKVANLKSLGNLQASLAQTEIQRLSQSIRLNEDAKSAQLAPEPLSQIKPSPLNADSGSMSVSDFRRALHKRR